MNPKRCKLKLSVLFILWLLPLSGCWDMVDLDQRTAVIGLGMDTASGSPIRVRAQIPLDDPTPIQLGGQPLSKPFLTISTLGQTMLDATHNLEGKAEKRLFWGQLKIVLITTALAKRGLKPLDILQKQLNIPPISWIALYEPSSPDILSASLGAGLPAIALDTSLQLKSDLKEVEPVRIWTFLEKMASKTTDAYLPLISFDPEERTYGISQIGVFRHSRLVGKLSHNETQFAGYLMGKTSFAITMIPLDKTRRIFFHRITSKTKIIVERTQPQISFLIRVKVIGFDPEVLGENFGSNRKDIKRLEKVTARILQKEMAKVIQDLQRLKSDILGLGEALRIAHPKRWNPRNWEEQVYPQAKVRVQVKFIIEQGSRYR